MEAQGNRNSFIESIGALPLVEIPTEDNLLDIKDARKAFQTLDEFGSAIPERTLLQRDIVLQEVMKNPELEHLVGHIVLTSDQLRGILAKMAFLASAQTAVDIGTVTQKNEAIRRLVEES